MKKTEYSPPEVAIYLEAGWSSTFKRLYEITTSFNYEAGRDRTRMKLKRHADITIKAWPQKMDIQQKAVFKMGPCRHIFRNPIFSSVWMTLEKYIVLLLSKFKRFTAKAAQMLPSGIPGMAKFRKLCGRTIQRHNAILLEAGFLQIERVSKGLRIYIDSSLLSLKPAAEGRKKPQERQNTPPPPSVPRPVTSLANPLQVFMQYLAPDPLPPG